MTGYPPMLRFGRAGYRLRVTGYPPTLRFGRAGR
ncbi:MAG TPA: hypothetical protein DCS15_06580 [Flavobacteriales bacterium]|nr:hypothetical protein [Flavobacteriales bacterium]